MLRHRSTRTALAMLSLLLILPLGAAVAPKPVPRTAAARAHAPTVAVDGMLKEGWYYDETIRLTAGTRYTMAGACDEDCSDLDLKLYDRDDVLLRQDVDPDDTPVIVYTARYSGTYRLRVIMASCSIEPCHWTVAVEP